MMYPRRLLIISMSQALIATSLALSILTFVISLTEFLPMREGDLARQESLQCNTFFCLIVPIVMVYCSQSRVIAALTQKWILQRMCEFHDCMTLQGLAVRLDNTFRSVASFACPSDLTNLMYNSEWGSN